MFSHVARVTVTSIGFLSVSAVTLSAEMIHLMARKGDKDAVMAEINKGVPVDLPSTMHTTESGVSPLFVAARFGRTEVVEALIAAGAEVDKFFENESGLYPAGTALFAASAQGHEAVVDLLLAAGADPTRYVPTIGTPLSFALEPGHVNVAAKLIAAGAPERIEAVPIDHLIAAADVDVGKSEATQCHLCHQFEPIEVIDRGLVGPPLWDIVGRSIGTAPDFEYSPVMSAQEGEWTYQALNSYLASPYLYMPGARMFTRVENEERRAAIIAYLRTLSDDPKPLP